MIMAVLLYLVAPRMPVVPVSPAQLLQGTSGPYEVRFIAYDHHGWPLYMRQAWVYIGSAEALPGRTLPDGAADLQLQDVDIEIRLNSVPESDFCAVPQASTVEVARQTFFGCQGRID